MGAPFQENEEFFTKLWLYLAYGLGVGAGVAAKLAVMARTKDINFKDIVINSTIAFATAFAVYQFLKLQGALQYALPASVFCGRFADDIFRILFDALKEWLKVLIKKI